LLWGEPGLRCFLGLGFSGLVLFCSHSHSGPSASRRGASALHATLQVKAGPLSHLTASVAMSSGTHGSEFFSGKSLPALHDKPVPIDRTQASSSIPSRLHQLLQQPFCSRGQPVLPQNRACFPRRIRSSGFHSTEILRQQVFHSVLFHLVEVGSVDRNKRGKVKFINSPGALVNSFIRQNI
jgi:hypothetical protein